MSLGRLFETPANFVAHVFAEFCPAGRPVFFADIEPVEDVEIFKDRVTIAGHRQDAKQFTRGPAGAGDFPSTYGVAATCWREAAELRHVASRQGAANRLAKVLAKFSQFGAGHLSSSCA